MARLTLSDAEGIIAGCKSKLDELGVKMCVAVVDPRGDLITMIRQDGAPWRSVMICQGKAVASVAWLRPSGELTDIAQSPVQRGLMAMLDGRMIPRPGRSARLSRWRNRRRGRLQRRHLRGGRGSRPGGHNLHRPHQRPRVARPLGPLPRRPAAEPVREPRA